VKLSTRAEAVKALGTSARGLDRMIERGAPGPKPGRPGSKRYDVPAIKAWRAERAARVKPNTDLAHERALLCRVQRTFATLKVRQAKGELVRGEDAEAILRALIVATKTALLAVPRRCVLAGLPREHEALAKREIVQALRDLAEVKTLRGLESIGGRSK
jgi:phage terminase Nu1 subunit (DNA packaging protein)